MMEFVLFLCAALSALTGAVTGARAPGIEVQIEQVAARAGVVAPVSSRTVAAIVQAQRPPVLTASRTAIVTPTFVLTPVIPVRGERRRE